MTFKHYVSSRFVFWILFVVGAVATPLAAQNVDPNFSAVPEAPPPTDINFQQIIQPDGKILIYNAPTVTVNGVTRSGVFRLNTDGNIDPTFTYNNDGGVGINNVMIAPDGKIILAGSAAPNHAKMVRLNPDGSLDNAFSVFIAAVGSPSFTGNWLTVNAIQPDGKVIATHSSWGNIMGTWYSYSMRRYNLDATVDSSFASPPLDGGHLVTTTVVAEMLPDSRFYLAVTSRSSTIGGSLNISRRMANGSPDPTYTAYSVTFGSTTFIAVRDLAVPPDGGVLAAGVFVPTAPGFPPQQQLRRYLPDGSPAPGFASPLVFEATGVHQLSDGKILYSASGGTAPRALMRLEANGTLDNTFTLDPAVTSIKNAWQVDSMNRPVFLAGTAAGPRLVRLLENGSIDPAFSVEFVQPRVPSFVGTLAVQTDGKVLVSGPFSFMNGAARSRIARLNADGSLDSTFDPGTGFSPFEPTQLVLQSDGKILALGSFTSYNGTAVSGVARINADGTLDNTFAVNATGGRVRALAVQPDGKIVIGGDFSAINGTTRIGIARLDAAGSVDPTFDQTVGGGSVFRILVEPSGKIAIGGAFATVAGVARNRFVRLEASGTLDPTFEAGPNTGIIRHLLQQPDGKYVVTESFSSNVVRFNSDGSRDPSFTSPIFDNANRTGGINTLLLLPDGGVLVGGDFDLLDDTTVRRNITRIKSNGSHDTLFMPNGANGEVTALAWYPGGRVMLGGTFSSIDNVARRGIARLNAFVLRRATSFDFDGDGRADISVVRPSTNRWYEAFSSTNQVYEETFGLAGDILTPADYDGDGVTDESIFRPSNGQFWYRSSVNGALIAQPWGIPGDIPRPSDFDGDGKADFVVFRPAESKWYRLATTGFQSSTQFGLPGDQPLVGDFDGDGKGDLAVFRPSNGDWWYAASSAGGAFRTVHWGQNGDIPVPADFDGDGKTDNAVYRPSEGGWYIYNSGNGSFTTMAFGLSGDRPVAADYDGDGRADIAVFRPSTGVWYILQSTSGFLGYQFGISTDTAIPGSLIP